MCARCDGNDRGAYRKNDAIGHRATALGPASGDAQAGAMLVEHRLDLIVFFWDPLTRSRTTWT